jgi:hypothetical protein
MYLVPAWHWCARPGDDSGSPPDVDAGNDAGPPVLVRTYADWTSLGGVVSDFHNPADNAINLQNMTSATLDYKVETGGTVTVRRSAPTAWCT